MGRVFCCVCFFFYLLRQTRHCELQNEAGLEVGFIEQIFMVGEHLPGTMVGLRRRFLHLEVCLSVASS